MRENTDETNIAVMANSIQNIEQKVTRIDQQLRSDYVTNDRLQLTSEKVARLEKLVYGVVAVVGTIVIYWIFGGLHR